MAKQPTPKPLEIAWFLSGFYTYRSQLFAPFKAVGINIVTYHEPVLDGADFELTDLYQWSQRPGFSQFCTEQLASGEIINQFYSARALNGVLLTMFDSNQRLATFSPTAITTVFEKTTTNQGFVNQVGDTTYFYDGVDAIRNDQIYGLCPNGIAAATNTLTVSATGGWLPDTYYAGGSVLLDYNGNIEYAASTTSAGASSVVNKSSSTHVVNATWWDNVSIVDQWRTTGFATSGGLTSPLTAFVTDDFGFSIPSTAVILGVQVVFGIQSQSSTTGTVAQVALFNSGSQIGTAKSPGTTISTTPQVLTYGLGTDTWGASLTPAIINSGTFGFAISCTFDTVRVFLDAAYSMRVYYFIPGGGTGISGVSGSELPTWSALPGSFTTAGSLRWNNLGSVGQWLPGVAYTIPSVILDTNNNLQVVSIVTAVEQYDNSTTYNSGDVVMYAGSYWTAQATFSGVVPNAQLYSTTVTGSTTAFVYNWIETSNPQTSGGTVPVWATTIGTQTTDGSLRWTMIGPGSILVNAGYSWGVCYRTMDGHLSTMSEPTLNTGPLLGGSPLTTSDISSFSITSDVLTVYADQNFSPNELVYIEGMTTGTYLNDRVFTVISAVPFASFSITSAQVTSNVVTLQAVNSLSVGDQVTLGGLTGLTALNGQTVTVLSSGLSGTQFEFNFTTANYGPAAETGQAVVVSLFTAAFTHADVAQTPDSGTVTPIIAQLTSTGITDSRLNYSAAITNVMVKGNIVTLNINSILFPGNTILVTGLGGAAFLNDYTLQLDTVTPTQATAYFVTPDYASTPDAGTATFCGIEIYRTADGGGIWYYEDALVNPGANNPWTFTSVLPDSNLNIQLIGPLAHQNDPPPGQLGSIATPFAGGSLCAYWQGRQWLAQGQYLYFDGGQDVLNGDPHQSWPPGNRFEYPGTIVGIAALDRGLVVLGADYFGLALGGPQTLAFYPIVISKNFGISSPNCLYQDGQSLHVLTTQGQLFEIAGSQKENEGHVIADYITNNFPPSTSYVTHHRNGLDCGLWLGNGTTTLLRSGTNLGGAWSVPYFPVGGIQAINSIETAVGTYSLCAAPATAAGYILARDLNTWEDYGGQYTSAFAANGCGINLGSITLSGPGDEISPVKNIIIYADAVGVNGIVDVPAVAFLPNEISATGTVTGFITIPEDQITPEPPPPAALVSTSLQQLRYPVNMANSLATLFWKHVQIRIIYPSTNAPHTVKAMAISFGEM